MASLTLRELYLHSAADLSDYITSDGFGAEAEDDAVDGEYQTRAAGRVVLVRRPGTPQVINVTIPAVSPDTVRWLRDHKGETLLLRDPRGRKVYGSYLNLAIPEKPGGGKPNVSFTFTKMTWAEG